MSADVLLQRLPAQAGQLPVLCRATCMMGAALSESHPRRGLNAPQQLCDNCRELRPALKRTGLGAPASPQPQLPQTLPLT
jgi:hypothetical protein